MMPLENVKGESLSAEQRVGERLLTGGETSSFPWAECAAKRKLRIDNQPTTQIVPRTRNAAKLFFARQREKI